VQALWGKQQLLQPGVVKALDNWQQKTRYF
jgi:hypothetical protein